MAGIMTADVRTYTKTRLAEGAEPATINRELAVLKRMFVLAVHGGKLLHRPHIPMLKEHNVRTGFFERDQFEAVRAHLHEIYRGATTFMYLTGWRIQSEVLCLQWPQVDWSSALIRLHPGTTKNDEGRMFPFDLLPELRDVLEAQRARTDRLKGRICPWVFHEAGRPFLDDTGHASHDFRAAWTAATTAAGCPGRIPHDFRRTAVRNLIRAGVSEKTAMQLTGHKTRAVFDRYDIVDERDLREAVRRLAAAPAPPSASRGRVLRVRKTALTVALTILGNVPSRPESPRVEILRKNADFGARTLLPQVERRRSPVAVARLGCGHDSHRGPDHSSAFCAPSGVPAPSILVSR